METSRLEVTDSIDGNDPHAMVTVLTVAICTRNREDVLSHCVESVLLSIGYAKLSRCEILVIDDGTLSNECLDRFHQWCDTLGATFTYHKKERKGLYASRLKAIELAKGEVILFLDDDVVVDEKYVGLLVNSYATQEIGGYSGIDKNLSHASTRMLLYQYLFVHSSTKPGGLSLTCFNGSITRWASQESAFLTDFFSGCNMSFRKGFLEGLPRGDIFNGYSVGEDLFISHYVSTKARLIVDPDARVIHKQVQESRDNRKEIATSVVLNHLFILRWFHPLSWRMVIFIWSVIGLIVKDFKDLLQCYVKKQPDNARLKREDLAGKVVGLVLAFSRSAE